MTPPKWVQRDMCTPEQVQPMIDTLEEIRKLVEVPEGCRFSAITEKVQDLVAKNDTPLQDSR